MDVFSSVKNNIQKTQNYDNINKNINQNKIEMQKLNQTNDYENKKTLTQKATQTDNKMDKEHLKKELQKLTEELNRAINPLNTSLKFKFNDKIDFLTVEVVDTKKNDVIRKFPSDEALRLMEKMKEVVGILFDKKG
ncbi:MULTISPECIES: flagellar protein FlaG [unclassified Lebetimonas]|uniref:flagellar protein FlaG n=1 Tax=unclassified Lebetimonas TaxID=2648158 RepID=UPI0004678EC1|nr:MULTISPECIES: flagellar protein FlaG [unclassified Lebetimonas]